MKLKIILPILFFTISHAQAIVFPEIAINEYGILQGIDHDGRIYTKRRGSNQKVYAQDKYGHYYKGHGGSYITKDSKGRKYRRYYMYKEPSSERDNLFSSTLANGQTVRELIIDDNGTRQGVDPDGRIYRRASKSQRKRYQGDGRGNYYYSEGHTYHGGLQGTLRYYGALKTRTGDYAKDVSINKQLKKRSICKRKKGFEWSCLFRF